MELERILTVGHPGAIVDHINGPQRWIQKPNVDNAYLFRI